MRFFATLMLWLALALPLFVGAQGIGISMGPGPGGTALQLFPQIAASATTNSGSSASTAVTLAAGTTSGNLLIVIGDMGGSITNLAASGWTVFASGSNRHIVALYRVADGSEAATVTVTWTTSRTNKWVALRITQWNGVSAPESGTIAQGTSTTPDPPSLTPSWGAANTLWIAASTMGNGANISSYPTNYGSNNVNIGSLAIASRELNASSTDPGTFTWDASNAWGAQTIAVRP